MATTKPDQHRSVVKEKFYHQVPPEAVPKSGLKVVRNAQQKRQLNIGMPFLAFLKLMNTIEFEVEILKEFKSGKSRSNSYTLQYAIEQTYPKATAQCKTAISCIEHVLSFQLEEGYPHQATVQKQDVVPILKEINIIK